MDERELLLLGLLRREVMYGYQLSQFLEHSLDSLLPMKRSTAYFLLDRLARRGLVRNETAREGKRPERRVYRLTVDGETVLDEELRRHLADHHPAYHPDAVGYFFLNMLPPQEQMDLLHHRLDALRERRGRAEERLDAHAGTPARRMMSHRVAVLRAEEAWLQSLFEDIRGSLPKGTQSVGRPDEEKE